MYFDRHGNRVTAYEYRDRVIPESRILPDLRPVTSERVEQLRAARRQRCADGYHDDPDNSGLCILCGAVLDED